MAQSKAPKKKPVGRPKSRPADYHQRSIWLQDGLQARVLKALVTPDGQRYEFSRLVAHLLRRWLDAGAKLPKE